VGDIEVYADIWCPFAHLSLRRVVEHRAALGREDVRLRVRAWPLELVNGAPLSPVVTDEHVHELRAQVAPGLFRRFDPAHFPSTTLPALALVHAAYTQDTALGERLSLTLRDALFEEGLDISQSDLLSELGRSLGVAPVGPAGVDADAVVAEWHEGEARGVRGSPHFFCGAAEVFCPSLHIERDTGGHLEIESDLGALDAFLTTCFAQTTDLEGVRRPRRAGAP
jgi:predicted DsbA family dithiol-disulfide isomerase